MRITVRRRNGRVIVALASLDFIGATPAMLRHHRGQPMSDHVTAAHRAVSTAVIHPAPRSVPTPQIIVAVGDSITKGDWDTAVTGGWVTRLATKLRAAYPTAAFTVRNAGVDGDTTAGVRGRVSRDVLAERPQLVIVSIGTNDFDDGVSPISFTTQLNALVGALRAGPTAPTLILASMLPIAGQTPQRLDAERAYNDIIRRTARAANIGYLDLFDPWLSLGSSYLHSLRHDTEHPNPIGYELLASTTAAFLEAGYIDARGRISAPGTAPTCALVCDAATAGPSAG